MCAAPIYFPGFVPSTAVRLAEEAIIAAEGPLTIGGYQCSNYSDADYLRRIEAECRVREAARRDRVLARGCVWCGQSIEAGQDVVIVAGRAMHVDACQNQFEQMAYGGDTEQLPEAA
ncbi:MAG: hypothetical protein ACR2M1_13375 [Gemmatimonadaceae bacterium]